MPPSPSTPGLKKPVAAKTKDAASTSSAAALLTPPRRPQATPTPSPSRSYILSPSSPAISLVEEDTMSVDLVTDVNENDIDEEVSLLHPTLVSTRS